MRRDSFCSAVLAVFLGGCVHRAAAPATSVQYASRLPSADTALGRRQPSDDAASALGWPLLNRVTLPEGTRELRIADWYSMIGGSPVGVVRLVEQPGRPVMGQLAFVWYENRAWNPPHRVGTCTEWNRGARICARVVRDTLDWPAVAKRLAELGAWQMSADCATDRSFVTDSGELLMRRLQGARYDQYQCNAPTFRTNSSAGRAALELYKYYQSLFRAQAD